MSYSQDVRSCNEQQSKLKVTSTTFIISHHDYIVARHLSIIIDNLGFIVSNDNIPEQNLQNLINEKSDLTIVLSRRNYYSFTKNKSKTISSDIVMIKAKDLLDSNNHNHLIEVPFLTYEIMDLVST